MQVTGRDSGHDLSLATLALAATLHYTSVEEGSVHTYLRRLSLSPWVKLYQNLNLDIGFAAVKALPIVAPPYTSAYTYHCFRAWLNIHKAELSLTSYLGETLINSELHPSGT